MLRLICLVVDFQLFYHHVLERLPFSHWIAFVLLSKLSWSYSHAFTSELYSVPLFCVSILLLILQKVLTLGNLSPLALFFFSKLFYYLTPLPCHIKFIIWLVYTSKKSWNFDGAYVRSIDHWHLDYIKSSSLWTWKVSIHLSRSSLGSFLNVLLFLPIFKVEAFVDSGALFSGILKSFLLINF